MMPSLHFALIKQNAEAKCVFCRGRNVLCTNNSNKHVKKEKEKQDDKLTDKPTVFRSLPDSLLLHIFQFLDFRTLLIARGVCRFWKQITEDRQLWKTTNFSCKRIVEKSWIFALPKGVRAHVRVMNLMWSSLTVSAFRNILKAFPKTEVLLLQNCRFSNDGETVMPRKRSGTNKQCFPDQLKVLDVRNVQDRWFDEYTFPTRFPCIEAVAFSQTLPNNWLSILSTSWMPNMKIIHIQNNPCVTETFLNGIVRNAPMLESINVQGCMNVNGSFLAFAIDNLENLRHVDVNSTRLDGKNLYKVDWTRCKIESLSISFCCKISSNDLKVILNRLVHLKHFQASFVGWGKSFNTDVVSSITDNTTLSIEYLDLQSTFHLSSTALARLCSKCPRLKNLRIGTILKHEEGLSHFLQSIPQISELSLQAGDCTFSATQILQHLAVECRNLKSVYLYNVQFDFSVHEQLQQSVVQMLSRLSKLENFFIGGYPHKERERVDGLIATAAANLNLRINTKRPRRVIPLHDGCFDEYLNRVVSIPTYNALGLRYALQRTHECQLFYQSGIQKLNSVQLLRNFN